jgi:hypothetical protein
MANLNISWALPTTRESGKPLNPSDILHVRIEISADGGANYGLVGDFPPDVLNTVVQDVDFGEWTVRGLVADTKGRVSNPVVAQVVNEDTTPPSELTLVLELA